MKAMIVGISGQDGAYLARSLLAKGYEVWGTSRDVEASVFSKLNSLGIKDRIHLETMLPTHFHNVFQVIKSVQPEEIYNLSGQSSVSMSFSIPAETLESSIMSTLNILESIKMIDPKIRYYGAGSGEMFGNQNDAASTEVSPLEPKSPYGVAKASAHLIVRNYREAYGLFACTGILFNHESPLRPERFVTKKIVTSAVRISRGSKEKLRLGNIDVERDWGWAEEYVELMWKMLVQTSPQDFVVATGTKMSLARYVEKAFENLGLDWREYTVIDESLIRPSEIMVSWGDPTKARELLDWKPMIVGEGVVRAMVETELTLVNSDIR